MAWSVDHQKKHGANLFCGYGGRKGAVRCTFAEPYDTMNGATWAEMVRRRLPTALREAWGHGPPPGGWLISIDGDTSLHCPAATVALRRARVSVHKGPPNSGDLRPVENWWPPAGRRLRKSAPPGTGAAAEGYQEFTERVRAEDGLPPLARGGRPSA